MADEFAEVRTRRGTKTIFGMALSLITGRNCRRGSHQYAGFWIRLGAYLIDVVLQAYIGLLVWAAFVSIIAVPSFGDVLEWVRISVHWGVFLLYEIYFPSGKWQATLGKRICGIYIVRDGGGKITGWLLLGRFFAYFLSTIPLCLGFLMIGWTDQKKGLHDIVCGTRVVYGKL